MAMMNVLLGGGLALERLRWGISELRSAPCTLYRGYLGAPAAVKGHMAAVNRPVWVAAGFEGERVDLEGVVWKAFLVGTFAKNFYGFRVLSGGGGEDGQVLGGNGNLGQKSLFLGVRRPESTVSESRKSSKLAAVASSTHGALLLELIGT